MICISEFELPEKETFYIDGFEFRMTCIACPEQYDVFNEYGVQVAYIRLRGGSLRVEVPDCCGETVYIHEFLDAMKGCFRSPRQRIRYLKKIAKILKNKNV